MILRKPYAFFIKHFKLIHIILAVLVFYAIYNTKLLLDFFNEYADSIINVIGQDLTFILLPGLFRFVPILIIIVTIVIMIVMFVKKKPSFFYIINILIYIYLFVIIQVSHSTLNTMSLTLIDGRTVRLVRDLIAVAFIIQFISAVFISVRATGFDVKKFNFKEDLKDLEISEEDREEVEVELTIDKNKINRNVRRFIRYFKYAYKENKLLANLTISGIAIGVVIIMYFIFFNQTPIIQQNQVFDGNGFTIAVNESYLTNTNYERKQIDNEFYYLILRIQIKNNMFKSTSFDIATTKVLIENYVYTPTVANIESFSDFGKVYQGEKISSEYENKVLIYQIPKQLIDKDMIFSYVDKNKVNQNSPTDSIKVKLNAIDLTKIKSTNKTTLTNELKLENSILDDYKIIINDFSIERQYKLNYDFCIDKECYVSYEYIKPSITTSQDKVLLRIKGNLKSEESIPDIYNLCDFIEKFGKIYYTVDNDKKVQSIKLKEIIPKYATEPDTYYIEILEEVIYSDKLSIVFMIRDRNYEYILK